MSLLQAQPAEGGRPPRQVADQLWLFAPNRDSQGGSAWWLESAGLLIDCPAFHEANLAFLRQRPAGRIVLTSREGHGRVRRFQEALGWPVLVQEQEAYLLPGVQQLQPFGAECDLGSAVQLRWTPGPTPGASVLLARAEGLLFCGRLLSPVAPGQAAPLRTRRSFHWRRWLQSLEQLRAWLPAEGGLSLASGAGLGALRGEALIPAARELIAGLDLAALALQEPR
jgi:glyoxylase-like metal-dependent hydrolase (beta-lactamase superfamily II)